MITIDKLKSVFAQKGYVWYADKPNIIGIRTTLDLPNHFNDVCVCVFPWKGKEEIRQWVITTDPGTDYLLNPLNAKGCSILIPGQYKDCYALGFHQSKSDHPALVQVGTVRVYRDNDKDNQLDFTTEDAGLFGINIHRAGIPMSAKIGKWSAGCQVFQSKADHDQLLWICEQYEKANKSLWKKISNWIFGKSGITYTYTLIEEKDLL